MTKHEESPLYRLLNEINAAAQSGLSQLAIAMTVALPDICVSLVSEDGRSNRDRYRAWCADSLKGIKFQYLTPDDLWSMRCGVLHNGRYGDLKHSVARVIFLLPNERMNIAGAKLNDAYSYSVVDFCRDFCDAVFQWSEANRQDEHMKANLPRMVQYYPQGLPPYIVGLPVLA